MSEKQKRKEILKNIKNAPTTETQTNVKPPTLSLTLKKK